MLFLYQLRSLLRQVYRKIKYLILKIQNKAIVGVNVKEFCCKEELIFPQEQFVIPEFKDVFGQKNKYLAGYQATIPPFYVRGFKNGICRTDREEVFVSYNQVISEYTSQKINPVIGTKVLNPSEIKIIKGTVAHLSLSGLENGYYSWLIEGLGRLYLIEKSSFRPDYYIIATKLSFQKQYLELLGIDNQKIIPAESKQLIQADELIVPTLINNWEFVDFRGYQHWPSYQHWQKQYLSKWIGNLYKEKLLPNIKKTQNKRIYISRRDAKYRKVINEQEVMEVLNTYGFKTVHLEDIKVIEQIELFANAQMVVSVHGAGLTNILFCPANTKVLEIYSQYYYDSGYRLLAHALGFSYNYLVGKTLDLSVHPQFEDVFVDIKEFREAVQILI